VRDLHWIKTASNVWETEERAGDNPEFRIVARGDAVYRMKHFPDPKWVPYTYLRDAKEAARMSEAVSQ
jgi:hypothetical protein